MPAVPAPDSVLTVLTLNVAAPTRQRARGLLELLWPAGDDIWVLTETSGGEGTRLIAGVCRAAGHTVLLSDHRAGDGRGVMVVGRRAGAALEEGVPAPVLLPGRVLPVQVVLRGWTLRLAGVYGAASDPVRYSSAAQRQRKRDWIAGLQTWLTGWRAAHPGPGAVVGDLNLADPAHDAELRHVLPEETAALAAMGTEHGLVDAYRRRHPDSREVSWVDHSGLGCRYDHAFVTADAAPAVVACDLVHDPRAAGLTDHSALRLTLRSPGPT